MAAQRSAVPYFTSNGCNIFVDRAGSGAPVLFLHAYTLDHRQWDAEVAALREQHQVFRMDLRGHGRSGRTPTGHTFAGRAADAARCLVQVGMEKHNPGILVGHSISADACLQAALAEPRAVKGVVVIAPAVWGQDWPDAWRQRLRGVHAAARDGDVAAALDLFRGDPIFAGVQRDAAVAARVAEMQRGVDVEALRGAEADAGEPTLERLARCTCPVLVVSPELDAPQFRAAAAAIAERAPNARLVDVKRAGHFANLEQPAAVAALLQEFFTACA